MFSKICQYLKPISVSLSPNTQRDDIWLAFKLLFQCWRWKRDDGAKELENQFQEYLGMKYAFSFNSGRAAFLAILHSLRMQEGDEVILQAFTCNAVPNPILWSGLKPVYVDCNEDDFNIDVEDLKRKIGPRSKAVVIQHTFGLPTDMDRIIEVCRQNNLVLIEDCAHSLGAEYGEKKVGSFGKIAFFSFSRDKVTSSVYGGAAATNDEELAKRIEEYREKIGYPSYCWISQQLFHPILMNWIILPSYRLFGKYLLILFQWTFVLSKAVHWKEKRGKRPNYFPKRMPSALAVLAINQLKKLGGFNSHRRELAQIYYEELKNTGFELPQSFPERKSVFLRFPVKHAMAHDIIRRMWRKNILIGDWYTTPIAPHDTKLEKMQYTPGSCPVAEKLAKTTLNLPTHINISKEEARKIIKALNEYTD